MRDIRRMLGVGTIVECSVRRAGERVRVAAQLIDTESGFHLWAETYEREGTDVFAIQNDLALRIAAVLKAQLSPAERDRLARRPTMSSDAHLAYLLGRRFRNQRTPEGFTRAAESFERAIAIDPDYAAAHAGLAIVHILQSLNGHLDPQIAAERTKRAALRALEIDPELAEAHVAYGGYLNVFEWDSERTEQEFRRAIELDPSDSYGRHSYAVFLNHMGRVDQAIAQWRAAVELDPLDAHVNSRLGRALAKKDPVRALEYLLHACELEPAYWEAHMSMGNFQLAAGQVEPAIATYQRALELAGSDMSAPKAALGSALARAGKTKDARLILTELEAEAARTGIYRPGVATVFLALGDVEGALTWLERSYRQRHPQLRLMPRTSDARLARDPRYLDLRRRIGLPQ